ncbi:putative disease resistance RPP13-like protein 1 [Humulus lupulus]|uniref:putative disease resistance RPP13-like protein 1 n=1 Tax=Humulus lupulus TaxID=3486 RepID=UPI002B4169EA|nr:putative disease resistance RPP13-like protein 1 [Humulus lupulus]
MAAELVAGALLSASLQVLFERLGSEEIPRLFRGKKLILDQLDELNTMLISANVLLNDAEEKQLRNKEVRMWLCKLQDVIYQADDLVDRIDYETLQSKLEDDQSSSSASKVFNQLKSMSPFMSKFDKSVKFNAMEILRKMNILIDQKDALGLREGAQKKPFQRPPAPLVEQYDVYGRDNEKEVIVDLLLKDDISSSNKICVIPIVGMGGVGKTTLAQLVYDDDRVQKHFELKVWVTVSDEFDISRITKEIFEGVTSYKVHIKNLEEIRRRLKEALKGKKFLFVHDDVWNESYSQWDTLKSCFDSGANGSKIIVTTRSTIVASTMATGQIHQLQTLLSEDCWRLFVKHAFGNDVDLSGYQDLQVIGRKIVEKCKGLPLAIKSLGGLLRSERDSKKWEDILNNDTWEELYKESSILPALWLSYRHLPAHLKQCFAYCSIFPKDYEFDREILILLWKAEGFLQSDKKYKKEEQLGEEYLQDLLSRSFFQHSSHKKEFFLQMHDLVHDLAMFVSYDFCSRLDRTNDKHRLSTKIRHLSYMKTWKYNADTLKCLSEANCLRTFVALPFERYSFERTIVLYDMFLSAGSCLRVLSLNNSSIKELPNSINNLKHLRYLDLSCTEIEELPDSICTLYNLQTLLLLNCYKLSHLPKKMGSLMNLRHLEIHGVPLREIPHMKHLHFLSNVVLSDKNSGGFRMKSVAKLANLRCISGLENINDAIEASEANLIDKKGLSMLTLSWNVNGSVADSSQKENDILNALRPHTNLEHLVIENYRGTILSEWIGNSAFSNLVSIRLSNCINCYILPSLGQLVSLKSLKINGCNSVISIGYEITHEKCRLFRCLEVLEIRDMLEWKDWSFCSEAMQQGQIFPLLKELWLFDCPKLNVGLPGYLPSLEHLNISNCDQMVVLLPRTTQQTIVTPPSLAFIWIDNCSMLESLLDWGSHLNVQHIVLVRTKKLFENHKQWDLHRLFNLEYLSISGWEDDSFPNERLLPTTLTNLYIWDSSNLETLNGKAFQQLTSLTSLSIGNCERLRCLPEEGLPTSLCQLYIKECPLLKQRCEKGAEDWPKIHRITKVELDRKCINEMPQ